MWHGGEGGDDVERFGLRSPVPLMGAAGGFFLRKPGGNDCLVVLSLRTSVVKGRGCKLCCTN